MTPIRTGRAPARSTSGTQSIDLMGGWLVSADGLKSGLRAVSATRTPCRVAATLPMMPSVA